jgi:hypothetical protein
VDGPLRRAFFQRFVDAVAERLDQGERIYNGSAVTRPLAELVHELEEEAEDLAGWSFWIWMRAARLRRELELAGRGLQTVAEQQKHHHHAGADLQSTQPNEESRGAQRRELGDVAQEVQKVSHAADETTETEIRRT